MSKKKRAVRYVRPADGSRQRRRAVCALTVIEIFLLALTVLLAVSMKGGV